MAFPRGLEPPTHSLGNCCSILMSYGNIPEKSYKENLQIIQQKTIAKRIILRYKLILLVDRWPSGRRRTIGNRVYP